MNRRPKSNFENPDKNPCLEESSLTQKCLDRNNFELGKCSDYFENYNNCKKFWDKVCTARSRAGIVPSMPTKEERDKIVQKKKEGVIVISAP